MKTALIFLLAPALAFAAPVPLKNKAGGGAVSFLAVGKPSMLKIKGNATGAEASLKIDGAKLAGSVDLELSKLETGISLRDEHMKNKYLQVKEYPKATLTLTEANVEKDFAQTLTNAGELPFKGTLKLHGQEKPVSGTYTAKAGLVNAKFTTTLSDYGIEVPKYLGVTVADSVDVSVELPLQK